jgi:hypothetical protein
VLPGHFERHAEAFRVSDAWGIGEGPKGSPTTTHIRTPCHQKEGHLLPWYSSAFTRLLNSHSVTRNKRMVTAFSFLTTPQHTTSHHITPHHTTSHHITPHHTTSHHITPHHTTSHHISRVTTPHHPPHYLRHLYTYYTLRTLLRKILCKLTSSPGHIAVLVPDSLFVNIIEFLIGNIEESKKADNIRTLIQAIGAVRYTFYIFIFTPRPRRENGGNNCH